MIISQHFLYIKTEQFFDQIAAIMSKCYKARHEGDCKSSPKSNYVYFDIESGSCGQYQACGHPLAGLNMFWNLGDCRAECASPRKVKKRGIGMSILGMLD
ncbi:hypothetical protein RF11_15813 [Thelohanellus kitauei]|uniref:BPTI/Kunitz inhibitor domain-containing protein n=1 Tax=Thelohanellus kitauei TaxID=669202 RepID=A0A0C2MQL5_THEKT|nr:hypothetical protein RF11_15813 [Thelohanellus kitauei]